MSINEFFELAVKHQKEHFVDCGALPYAHGSVLTALAAATKAKTILEVGTGIGYSTVCLALGNPESEIHTIDKNPLHIKLAHEYFKEFNVENQITTHMGTAEDIMPTLNKKFDLIFYDGFVPQRKFVFQLYNLLENGGMLISTNLFLAEDSGGKYVKMLKDDTIWKTGIIDDTAFSVKVGKDLLLS